MAVASPQVRRAFAVEPIVVVLVLAEVARRVCYPEVAELFHGLGGIRLLSRSKV